MVDLAPAHALHQALLVCHPLEFTWTAAASSAPANKTAHAEIPSAHFLLIFPLSSVRKELSFFLSFGICFDTFLVKIYAWIYNIFS